MLGYDAFRWHAALNDLPAALLFVAVLFDLAGWLLKRDTLRAAGLWTLWAGVVGGWIAVIAGNLAEEALEHAEAMHELLERHEAIAQITMLAFTLVLAQRLWRRGRTAARAEEWFVRVLGIGGLVGLLVTASLGGTLVFEHGAGVAPGAAPAAELQDREPEHRH